MIKVLTVGDPHFKVDNIIESDEMTQKLVKLAQTTQPKFIVVLGDILHRHEKIHVSPLMRAEKMIRLLSEIAPTFVLIGNHDRPNNSTYMTNEHPFNALKLWPNTYVVDEKVLDANIGGYRFLFVPYVFPGKFEETLNHSEKGAPNWNNNTTNNTRAIFCHQEFFGAKMGAIQSQCGDKWPTTNPLVISGHIHDYDKLQENIIYTGTSMQHAFGDSSDKCISIFTFDENGWVEDRVDLGLVKKVIVYLDCEQIHTYEPPTDKLIKIVIRGDDAALKSIAKLEKIKELKKMGIKIAYKANNNITEIKTPGPILRLTFKDRLYTTVCKNEKELAWFNKLFK